MVFLIWLVICLIVVSKLPNFASGALLSTIPVDCAKDVDEQDDSQLEETNTTFSGTVGTLEN